MTDRASKFAADVAALQVLIYSEEYFPTLWEQTLADCNLTAANIANCDQDPQVLTNVLNEFWCSLPDHPSIRTPVFMRLCDLCTEWYEGVE